MRRSRRYVKPIRPLKPKKGLGKGVKIAMVMAVVLAVAPVMGYYYILDQIKAASAGVEAEIVDIRLMVYERRAALNITIEVYNPTEFTIDVNRVVFDVIYRQEVVGTGCTVENFTMLPKSYNPLWLIVTPKAGETFYVMLEGLMKGGIWIKIEGTIYASVNILGLYKHETTQPFFLYKKIEKMTLFSMDVEQYINITRMEVLEPGTRLRIYLNLTNPFIEAAEPLPLNITDVDLVLYMNETYFGVGSLEEPVQIPPKSSAEAKVLVNTTEEAIRQIIELGMTGGTLVIRSEGNVTAQLYDVVVTRSFEHELTYSVGPGVELEELFNFTVKELRALGEQDDFYLFEALVEVNLVAPKMPVELIMAYNITEFSIDIYEVKDGGVGKYIGKCELMEPIQAELANITRPAHVRIWVEKEVFDQTLGGASGEQREIDISFAPKNLSLTLQIYEVSVEIERPEVDLPEPMGFHITIGGIPLPSPNALNNPVYQTELWIVVDNPTSYDVEIVSVEGEPAVYFDLYCLEHNVYLGYGYLNENITIPAKGSKAIAITIVITNTAHIRTAHLYGFTIDITMVVKNGYVKVKFFDVVLTITFHGVITW